jgi:hypothetical protein
MNRRQALATLMAMPAIQSVVRAEVKPEDVIVVECSDLLTSKHKKDMAARLRLVWPNNKIVIFDRGLTLKVVRS